MSILWQPGGGIVLITFILALILESIALPPWADPLWPHWLALSVIYWCMQKPQQVGIGTAWLLGLLLDAAQGTLLGQHALALAVVAYLTLRTYRQLRLFPLWQQTFGVLLLVLIELLLTVWINGMLGYPPRDAWFLAPAVGSLFGWLIMVTVMRDLGRHYHYERR